MDMNARMRRRDRQINDREEILAVVEKAHVCHLAMCAEGRPYVVPMVFVYADGHLYFHCAEVGLKLDILRQNDQVCFEMECSSVSEIVQNTGMPCDWGFAYESVIGFGRARLIEAREEKLRIYDLLVEKLAPADYRHQQAFYVEKKIKGTYIIDVTIESMTGKRWDGVKPVPTGAKA